MAYGVPWSDRDYEPDPRDVVEEAARAAGMTVSEWLNRAGTRSYGQRPSRQQRRRHPSDYADDSEGHYRAPRPRHGMGDTGYSEDRIARILDGAMGNIEDSLRTTEERTTSALKALSRRLNEMERSEDRYDERASQRTSAERYPDSQGSNKKITSVIAEIENALGNMAANSGSVQAPIQPLDNADLVRKLESKISNVVNLLEAKSTQRSQAPQAAQLSPEAIALAVRQELRQTGLATDNSVQAERLASVENAIRLLASKMDAPQSRQDNTQSAALFSALEDMQNVVRGLKGNGQQTEVLDSIRQLEQRLGNAEQPRTNLGEHALAEIANQISELRRATSTQQTMVDLSPVQNQISALAARIDSLGNRVAATPSARDNVSEALTRIHEELNRLRQKPQTPEINPLATAGLSAIERQMGSMSDRLDALTEKLATARLNGARDLRAPKPVDSAVEELKSLILKSHAPSSDTLVLDSLQTLVRKVDTIERGPADLVARLDRIQSMVGEKPAQAMPKNLEPLLQNIVSRLEQVQTQPVDDKAFDKLHQEIRQLSQKLEATPGNLQIPAGADISGVERHLSELFRQMESWKTDLGEATQRAASKAAQDAVSQKTFAPSVTPDNSHVEKTLADIQTTQQEGERRTNQTLEAVHTTLQRVVDRLVDMEREIQAPRPAVMQPVVQQVVPAFVPPAFVQPAFVQPAETFVPAMRSRPLEHYTAESEPHPHPQVPVFDPAVLPAAINEADQSFAKTLTDMRPARPQAQPEIYAEKAQASDAVEPVKTGIAAAFAAARNAVSNRTKGKARIDDAQLIPQVTEPDVRANGPSADNSLLDLPLEPGSGRPGSNQSARVATSSVAAMPAAATTSAITATPADPKAAFLAAARRAAQAAAEQSAEVLAQGQKKAMPGAAKATAAGAKAGLTKKHAILLGLAALIVAVGATMQFMGGSARKPTPAKDAPERTSTLLPAPKSATAAAPAQPARQILPSANNDALPPPLQISRAEPSASQVKETAAKETLAHNDDRVTPTPPRAASPSAAFGLPDPPTVGSINPSAKVMDNARTEASAPLASAPSVKSIASDPLFKFEGLRGAERLKQAARAGDPNAFLELGNRYADGRGAVRDPKVAAQWYERAAEFGSAPAQYRLASMYREGRGLERNPKVALKHFQTAADAGNARAMHNTAVLLAEGVNGSPDYAGAADWFKKAAEFGIKDSQFNLAILYARGLGTSQDLMSSYAWFAAAAGQGDEDAVKKRDEVGSRLSPERLEQAKTAAASWKARTPEPSANEVIVPQGGWDDQAKTTQPAAKPKATRS